MKSLFLAASLLLMASSAPMQNKRKDYGLPELHKIQRTTLTRGYSCPVTEQTEQTMEGYAKQALFLSGYSRQHNGPELLFYVACSGPDYFTSATAGDQLDVLSDFGEVRLDGLIASDVFGPHRSVNSMADFREMIKIQAGHTYAVLINKGDIHGFFFFQVVNYVPNQKLELEYVVMNYSIFREEQRTPGFDWDKKSYY
jgi:hypothetical protein